MAKHSEHLASSFETENTGGFLTGFLAEEDKFDRRSFWRLGSWGVAAVGAVIVALLAQQSSIGWRRDQIAAADLAHQSQQIQSVARESQNETRRLASAIDTLNGDRDRLYSRVTVLEQGLDSATGAIARQNVAAASPQAPTPAAATVVPQPISQNPTPPPVVAPVATTVTAAAEKPQPDAKPPEPSPATAASIGQGTLKNAAATPVTPLMPSKSIMAPPDAAAGKLIEAEAPAKTVAAAATPETAAPVPEVVASVAPAAHPEPDAVQSTSPTVAVQRTEFGVDVGGANSIPGLRALWRGLLKWRSNAALTALRPIIVIKESSTGLGMQLRLVAGPLNDAAAAAKICAGLIENERPCETTLFEGQRLAMKADDASAATDPDSVKPAAAKPAKPPAKPAARRRSTAKRVVVEESPQKPEPTTLSSFFSRR
jgi:hypothetical protein